MEHSVMRKYVPPTLLSRGRLSNMVEGTPPVVSMRRPPPKGGCFEAREKRTP